MPRTWLRPHALMAAMAIAVCAGCTAEAQRYIRFPNLLQPGPAGFQRAEAVRHDPYPLSDVGPEVVGGRPREYQVPVNEVERARMATAPPLRPVPLPAIPVAPPAFTAPPPAVTAPPPVITTPAPVVPYQPPTVQPRAPY